MQHNLLFYKNVATTFSNFQECFSLNYSVLFNINFTLFKTCMGQYYEFVWKYLQTKISWEVVKGASKLMLKYWNGSPFLGQTVKNLFTHTPSLWRIFHGKREYSPCDLKCTYCVFTLWGRDSVPTRSRQLHVLTWHKNIPYSKKQKTLLLV